MPATSRNQMVAGYRNIPEVGSKSRFAQHSCSASSIAQHQWVVFIMDSSKKAHATLAFDSTDDSE